MGIVNVTLNPNDTGGTSVVLSNGNLTATTKSPVAGDIATIRATHGKKTGKWYWEIQHISGNLHLLVGIANLSFDITSNPRSTSGSALNTRSYNYTAIKFPENTTYGTAFTTGFTIGVTLDLDNGTLGFYKDGVFQGVSHTNVSVLGEVYPFVSDGGSTDKVWTINFGANPFKYPVPNGYTPYNYEILNKFLISSGNEHYSIVVPKINNETAIPKMTSDTTPSGRAFAKNMYSTGYAPWYAFNRIDDQEGYVSLNNNDLTGFLGYEFISEISLYKYAIRSGFSSFLNKMPKNWTFEGSNDGTNWTVLDTQTNQTWTTQYTDKEYLLDIRFQYMKFKMYRVNWTANNGFAQYTEINELKMFEIIVPKYVKVPSLSEINFNKYGMSKDVDINLRNSMISISEMNNSAEMLGSGKVFKQKIDRSKHRAKKIILG